MKSGATEQTAHVPALLKDIPRPDNDIHLLDTKLYMLTAKPVLFRISSSKISTCYCERPLFV
jgi:hypothetical protein